MIDAHNHLQDERLAPWQKDFAELRVKHAVVNGTAENDWPLVLSLARKHPWIIPSLGLHPWFVKNRGAQWFECLQKMVEEHRCAIGEIGLDRWIDEPDLPAQEDVFIRQLRLAAKSNLPVTIHCLKAWGRLAEILRAEPRPACGFLLHSYGGPKEMVKGLADLGGYFSISGYFANERKSRSREAFRAVPLDRLLIETDAPDMAPPESVDRYKLPGNVNHPGNIETVYDFAAELFELPREELEAKIERNFQTLFAPVLG